MHIVTNHAVQSETHFLNTPEVFTSNSIMKLYALLCKNLIANLFSSMGWQHCLSQVLSKGPQMQNGTMCIVESLVIIDTNLCVCSFVVHVNLIFHIYLFMLILLLLDFTRSVLQDSCECDSKTKSAFN
jgi:hypothetical protein